MKLYGVFGFSRSWLGLHEDVKYYNLDEPLFFWCEDSWACIRGCASSLLKSVMAFGVLHSNLVGPSWRHMNRKEPVSWRVSVCSWWILLEVIWNRVSLSCWVEETFVGRLVWCFSSVKWWEDMYGAFYLNICWKLTIDIGVWWELQVATTNSI